MSDYPSNNTDDLPLFASVAPKKDDSPTVLLKDFPDPRKPSGGKQLARENDPGSSHVAAAETGKTLPELQSMFMDGLNELIESDGSVIVADDGKMKKLTCGQEFYTANEVGKFVVGEHPHQNIKSETIRKRSGELAKKNLVRTSTKVCQITGKKVAAFGKVDSANG